MHQIVPMFTNFDVVIVDEASMVLLPALFLWPD
jgi:superfamily I DNA and/or RNA helicase